MTVDCTSHAVGIAKKVVCKRVDRLYVSHDRLDKVEDDGWRGGEQGIGVGRGGIAHAQLTSSHNGQATKGDESSRRMTGQHL